MHIFYQFFRLIRLSNLLVIVLTMCLFYWLIYNNATFEGNFSCGVPFPDHYLNVGLFARLGLTDINFILFIVSVVLVAASGNIINDYFDQKADRINKPDRVIIDKYIKRRWAILLNWAFNGIAFLIAIYLSFALHNWWILVITFFSINVLYFYSAIYKRKLLTGNIVVALLTAIVPLYVYIYFVNSSFGDSMPYPSGEYFKINSIFGIVLTYATFAFLLNFIREVIKDMADVKGDLLLQSKTLPIRIGFKKTKSILVTLFIITLLPLVLLVNHGLQNTPLAQDFRISGYFHWSIILVTISVLISLTILITKNRPKSYLLSSNFIKAAMLFGVISALFYAQ